MCLCICVFVWSSGRVWSLSGSAHLYDPHPLLLATHTGFHLIWPPWYDHDMIWPWYDMIWYYNIWYGYGNGLIWIWKWYERDMGNVNGLMWIWEWYDRDVEMVSDASLRSTSSVSRHNHWLPNDILYLSTRYTIPVHAILLKYSFSELCIQPNSTSQAAQVLKCETLFCRNIFRKDTDLTKKFNCIVEIAA